MDNDALRALDEAVHGFRVAAQRPAYRRHVLDGLGFDGGIASLRVLRVVQSLTVGERGPSIRLVASELGVEHSTASRLVDGLAKSALLTRRPCGEDKRRASLSLTNSGRAILDETTTRRRQVISQMTASWPEQDVASLTRLLDRLRVALDERFARS